jgi:hypothetical protein
MIDVTDAVLTRLQAAFNYAERESRWKQPATLDRDGVRSLVTALDRLGLLVGGSCPTCGTTVARLADRKEG